MGSLVSHWAEWFDGLTQTFRENGTTVLTGPVADQAALYGLLDRLRDVGLVLISVNLCETDPAKGDSA